MPETKLLTTAATPPERDKSEKKKPEPIALPAALERNRLLDTAQSAAMLNYSLAHFRRLYQTGKLPPPVRINGRKMGWPAGMLIDLMASRQIVV